MSSQRRARPRCRYRRRRCRQLEWSIATPADFQKETEGAEEADGRVAGGRVGARLQRGDEVRAVPGRGGRRRGWVRSGRRSRAVELLGGEEVDRAVSGGHSATAADRDVAAVFFGSGRVPVDVFGVGDGVAGGVVAGLAGFFGFPLEIRVERVAFFPHVDVGAAVGGVLAGEVFFRREEDLGAVGGHPVKEDPFEWLRGQFDRFGWSRPTFM